MLTKCIETSPAPTHISIGADAADMVRVAQGHDRDPVAPRPLDADQDRVAGDDLPPAALAVIDDDRPPIADDPAGLVRGGVASRKVAQIGGDHADPVAVMAFQIGFDEVLGDERRLVLGAAGGGEDMARKAGQLVGGDGRHQSSPSSCWRAAMRSACAG
jgi:hypothetical protein